MQQAFDKLSTDLGQLFTLKANPDNFEMSEDDTQLVGNVLTNDSIIPKRPVTITVTKQPKYGTVTVNDNGSFTYTPYTTAELKD